MPMAKQREVRFSDFAGVAALKERWGLGKDSLANWYRLWQHNPAVDASKAPLPMGWVLEAEDGIVGYQGSVALRYHYAGRSLVAVTGTNLVVEPEYRACAAGLLISFFRQEHVDLFLVTTAIPTVATMSKALRANAVPQRDYSTALCWVLNAREVTRVLAAKLGLRGTGKTIATAIGSLALTTERSISRRRPRHGLTRLEVTKIDPADIGNEFDVLWRRQVRDRPQLLADRSSACLKWHFLIPGRPSSATILCCRRSEELVGYAIVQHSAAQETGLRRTLLADLLVERDDVAVTENLLGAAYADAMSWGSHVFEVVGFPANVRGILLQWKPYVRSYPDCPFFYKVTDQTLARSLAEEKTWYASPFDGDTTLML
jgi:hypothetical protein